VIARKMSDKSFKRALASDILRLELWNAPFLRCDCCGDMRPRGRTWAQVSVHSSSSTLPVRKDSGHTYQARYRIILYRVDNSDDLKERVSG
jgi:hypothetical protein